MNAPVMRLNSIHRSHTSGSPLPGDDDVIEGTLTFDDEPMCRVRAVIQSDDQNSRLEIFGLPGQPAAAFDAALSRVLDLLPRVSEWIAIRGNTMHFAEPWRVIRNLAAAAESPSEFSAPRGDILLRRDLSDLPVTSHYVLASDDTGFGRDPDPRTLRAKTIPSVTFTL